MRIVPPRAPPKIERRKTTFGPRAAPAVPPARPPDVCYFFKNIEK
jgi:hypothetical protein